MNRYKIFKPESRETFKRRTDELDAALTGYLGDEERAGRHLQYAKIFLSDAQNQYHDLMESSLYRNHFAGKAVSIVGQPPVEGSKISVLTKTTDGPDDFIFQSLRLTEEEAEGLDSYQQTMLLFGKYLDSIKDSGLTMSTNLVRTWIYVAGIDVNYAGVVRARNDIFDRYGLTADTHYVASTGIGGHTAVRHALVAIDFLTLPTIAENDKKYLEALDHLNPTHEYGVAFERGTRISHGGENLFLISGTASIDSRGRVVHIGDVGLQTRRLLENIDALLSDGGASLDNVNYFVIYLRDPSDYNLVDGYMKARFPDKPFIIVAAKVCRPEWLIEMECTATI